MLLVIDWKITRVLLTFRTCCDFVEVLAALLAKILLRTCGLIHNSDTATVLPDLTDIALYEQATQVVAFQ
jgi:hypothetical protein